MASMIDTAYLSSLGLKYHPFPVAPDDRDFYTTDYLEQVIAEIVHGIAARKGFMVLSGDVGVGKTTITRRILKILTDRQVRTSLVFHTSLKDVDLLREINRDFGLNSLADDSPHRLGDHLQQLNEYLVAQYRAGRNCAIIIDDAQNLDRGSLELVRMISNLEAHQQKLVQILLVGQTELMTRLNDHAMRQLHSRIVIRKVLRSLSRGEQRHYIAFKLNRAGDQQCITVTPPAYLSLYRRTRGNFRRLNLLMDRCLYALCRHGQMLISRKVVNLAHADLYPEKCRLKRRAMALAASAMLPLLVVMASWGIHLHASRSLMAAEAAIGKRFKVPQPQSVMTAAISPAAASKEIAPAPHGDSAVEAFLSIYQLHRYSQAFQQALEQGRLNALAQRIFAETGYQLVKLKSVPDALRRHYGALTFSVVPNQPPVWLLFWQPQLELRRFYPNYSDNEIRKLQQLLADRNLYRYKIDGIVGTRLTRAVVAFQKQLDLPVTGFPDTATLFWLCHQQGKGAPWPKA